MDAGIGHDQDATSAPLLAQGAQAADTARLLKNAVGGIEQEGLHRYVPHYCSTGGASYGTSNCKTGPFTGNQALSHVSSSAVQTLTGIRCHCEWPTPQPCNLYSRSVTYSALHVDLSGLTFIRWGNTQLVVNILDAAAGFRHMFGHSFAGTAIDSAGQGDLALAHAYLDVAGIYSGVVT